MKSSRNYSWLMVLVLLLTLASCQSPKSPEQPLVVTSIYPYQILLQEILGPAVKVVSIIPPSASPHDWSPNPSNLQAISKASLIVTNGLGLEQSLSQVLKQHQAKNMVLANLIDLKPGGKNKPQVDHEHEGGIDPHIWTSATNLVMMVEALEPELKLRFPEMADSIMVSSNRIKTGLQSIDNQIRLECAGFKDPGIITYHNSFDYFLKDYGIRHLASVQSAPGKEPSPRELSQLGQLIKSHGLKAIFVEPQMSQKSADVLAREFDLKVLVLDPIGNSLGAKTIGEFLLSNWKILKLGLEPISPPKK